MLKKTREKENVDDLTRIKGIADSVQEKLYQAGMYTFFDLAKNNPETIASTLEGLIGFSAKRIERENWIGQAAQFALLSDKVHERIVDNPYELRQSYAVFTIKLLLDAGNLVRRTEITDLRTQKKMVWAGWDLDKLNNFIRQNTNREMDSEEKSSLATTLEDNELKFEGELQIRSIDFIDENEEKLNTLLMEKKPMIIRVLLDLSDVALVGSDKLNIKSYLYTKRLGSKTRRLVAHSTNIVAMADKATVQLKVGQIRQGEYRLDVVVVIRPEVESIRKAMELKCLSEGVVIKVR